MKIKIETQVLAGNFDFWGEGYEELAATYCDRLRKAWELDTALLRREGHEVEITIDFQPNATGARNEEVWVFVTGEDVEDREDEVERAVLASLTEEDYVLDQLIREY